METRVECSLLYNLWWTPIDSEEFAHAWYKILKPFQKYWNLGQYLWALYYDDAKRDFDPETS